MMTLDSFKSARSVLSGVINETNLIYSPAFSASCGNNVYLKPENMQVTGAYKIRGAYFKISTLSEEEKALGLITASAGNHAQGVAYAARHAGVSATVVMPTTTPMLKVNNTKGYGAKVILHGSTFDDAAAKAMELAESEGMTYIPPFNDLTVATGQGTIAYEIFQDLPDVDIILVPIGGGGLAAGVSTLAKLLNPNVKVIGVEPEGAACMKASLEAGHVVSLPTANTIADGTAVKTPGDKVFPYIRDHVDQIITIPDTELVEALAPYVTQAVQADATEEAALEALGIRVVSGEADFLLLYTTQPIYDSLLAKGILIRNCENFRGLGEGYYRIAVKKHEENEVLLQELAQITAE